MSDGYIYTAFGQPGRLIAACDLIDGFTMGSQSRTLRQESPLPHAQGKAVERIVPRPASSPTGRMRILFKDTLPYVEATPDAPRSPNLRALTLFDSVSKGTVHELRQEAVFVTSALTTVLRFTTESQELEQTDDRRFWVVTLNWRRVRYEWEAA